MGWPLKAPQTAMSANMPMIIPPGDGAANGLQFTDSVGNFTLSSALPFQPTNGAYLWLPAGRLTVGNLLTYSEDFSNSAWGPTGTTKTATNEVDRLGATHALLLTATAGAGNHHVIGSPRDFIAGVTYTDSIYVKPGTATTCQLTFNAAAFGGVGYCNFDLVTGTITSSAVGVGKIELDGGGYWRITYSQAATASANGAGLVVSFINSPTATRLLTFTATGTETLYLCDAQCEIGSVAQAYTSRTATAGNLAGMVYATFSSATAGKVWNHQYVGGAPIYYTSPVALAGVTTGWLTQTTNADLTLLTLPYIGGSMGPSGGMKISSFWNYNNDASTKTITINFGGQTIFVVGLSTTDSYYTHVLVGNKNSYQAQISNNWTQGGATNADPFVHRTTNTAINQTIYFYGKLNTDNTDYIILNSALVEIFYFGGTIV